MPEDREELAAWPTERLRKRCVVSRSLVPTGKAEGRKTAQNRARESLTRPVRHFTETEGYGLRVPDLNRISIEPIKRISTRRQHGDHRHPFPHHPA
jgi:hypothetical protein